MKVAIPVWDSLISPVFDSASKLLIAEIENKKVIRRSYEMFSPDILSHLIGMLNELKINILICGAISETPANAIESSGIKLVPFIAGKANDVLESYAKGISIFPVFSMPGCGCQRRRQGKQHKRGPTMLKGDGAGQGKGCGNTQSGRKPSQDKNYDLWK